MSLEVYTGLIKDLVITNPTPTDPKSQGDDHLRGIKKTIVDDAVRVSGSPLQQMGNKDTAGENHFWDASAANQLSLKRGTPGAPGAELIKALDGVLSFPSQGQSLASNGYVKLPGGLIIQWGADQVSLSGGSVWTNASVTLPIPFPNAGLSVVVSSKNAAELSNTAAVWDASFESASSFRVSGTTPNSSALAGAQFNWIAIGY